MLNGGLIGLGRMGLTHLAILNTHPGVRWAAVCDTTPLLVKNLQERIGFSGYSDHRRMLSQESLDFVVVATPTAAHAEAIELGLQSGIAVFCEKPMTLSADVSEALARTAHVRGVTTQVGYVNRFNAVFAEAKSLLERRAVGTVINYRAEMHGRTVLAKIKAGWRSKKTEGGGCLYEFASHCVDLVQFFFGPAQKVEGSRLERVYSESVEDIVYSTLYHTSLAGQIFVNWSDESFRRPYNRVDVFGDQGRLLVDQQELKLYLRQDRPDLGLRKGWNIKYVTDLEAPVRFYLRGHEFTRQLDHFIDKIYARSPSEMSSFEHGAATDRTLDMIKMDAKN